MNLIVKELEKEDIPSLAIIMSSSFKLPPWNETWSIEECKKRIEDIYSFKTHLSYVLKNEDRFLGLFNGYYLPYMKQNELTIVDFFVDKTFEYDHLGSTFYKMIEEKLQSKKIDKITLSTTGSLDKFYSSVGFDLSKSYLMEKKIK